MLGHAGLFGRDAVLGKGARGHRDNRNRRRVGTVHLTNQTRRLVAAHARHHHVHEDCIDGTGLASRKKLNRLLAIVCNDYAHAFRFQQKTGDFHVQVVVLCQEDGQPRDGLGNHRLVKRAGLVAGGNLERQVHVEGRALALHALHRDGAAQPVHQALGNRHAQTGTAVLGTRRLALLFKGLKDAIEELRIHADSGVSALELDQCRSVFAKHFLAGDVDLSARPVVLDRVAQDIGHNPLEMNGAAH